jgi:hypothetical protein
MAYVNIPDSRLGIGIAGLIGRLLALLSTRITREVNSIRDRISQDCGNTEQIKRLASRLSGLRNSVEGIRAKIERIRKVVTPLGRVITLLSIAIRVLKLLPIPNRFTTSGLTNIFSDILHKLKEFVKQLRDDIVIVNVSCNQALTVVEAILAQLSSIDLNLKYCAEKAEAETEQQLTDAQTQLIIQNGFDPIVIEQALQEDDPLKLGNELFKDTKSLQDFNSKTQDDQKLFSENLGLDRKDVAKAAFARNTDLGMPLDEALQKTNLTLDEGLEVKQRLSETASTTQLPPEPPIPISTESTVSPEAGVFLVEDFVRKEQKVEDYIGPDGTYYEILIQVTDTSKVAPRRRAVARDAGKVVRFRSDESFSSSVQVLAKEVKFKIDNNIN